MREKVYEVMNRIYGILMTVAFFAGFLPVIPFIIAIIIGGPAGEALSVFLYKKYYVWVIALASIAVLFGLITMYVGGKKGLSVKAINSKD